ncbi:SLBB domain-containing protein [Cyclobacteriaceae bacterium]|nr:SLBB domain-containing protein [Cyclobacteriaceae bacterium]MDB4315578.1 SLBB domain-containing protein [Cyclobacteriaceae bacterium]MDB4742607.1 SLBB domain-containing protein [Cyclobacteriaceae bacterium]
MSIKLKRILLILSLGILVIAFPAVSQEIPDLDKLSDDQLKSFIQKAEEGGYTEDQLLLGAKARGMSDAQISKFRARINKIKAEGADKKGQNAGDASDSRMRQNYEQEDIEDEKDLFDPFGELMGEKTDTLPKIFGMNYFKNNQLSFEPNVNIPTPINYRLGPGDEIIIDLWGDSEQTYQEQISPDGYIRIERLGPIYLNGLEIGVAKKKINAKLKTLYGTLGSSTYSQISLGQIRSIRINVIGEVMVPGTYTMSSLGSAFNALYLAGGPQETGSLRRIEVYRNGKFHGRLDAYQFLIFGEGQDISLSDGDVVIVKPYDTRVFIDGEIKRPAFYDMMAGESLTQLFEYAGGPTDMGYTDRVTVRRKTGNFRAIKSLSLNDSSSLMNGDEIEIQSISRRFLNRIQIEGAVNFPGVFEHTEGLMLSSLIEQSGGLARDAFLGRGIIIRLDPDLNLTSESFNVGEVVNGTSDIALKNEDFIKIPSIQDLKEEETVRIEGEIQKGGNYPYIANMTVEDLILLADGFKTSAARANVEVARRGALDNENAVAEIFNFKIDENLTLSPEASKMKLLPFDLITIRRAPGYGLQELVEIEGEIKYPGKYGLKSTSETIYDLLVRAGGLRDGAYTAGATLIRRSDYTVSTNSLTNYRANIKRNKVLSILENDTAAYEQALKKLDLDESIGIDLAAIISNPNSDANMTLQEGDIISIPKAFNTVQVRGEVLNPSKVKYSSGLSLGQYIGRTGGFSSAAKRSKAYVIYANGSSQRTTTFLGFRFYPKVLPGTDIIIPRKPESTKPSVAEIVGLASALASLTLIINSLTQ